MFSIFFIIFSLTLYAFFRSIRHRNAGLLYFSDFSVIRFITNIASVHNLPVRKPYCLSAKLIL
ncbi:unnamed protein product [Diabrotica balteata]|uniref:Uncharacterized protein n=1 Tax=Diabrotica balteata TaxID=107213 RepID=A0A9N9T6D4_DIABA|nr:unnamed protein product [Diabrotica balteata]